MTSTMKPPYQYKTIIKDVTTSIVNCPNRDNVQIPKMNSFKNTVYTTKASTLNKKYLKTETIEPNAGHNATVNSYVFDPSLTTLKKPDQKNKIVFSGPIIDEAIYDNANNVQSEYLLNNIDKDLSMLKEENEKFAKTKKKKTFTKPSYISEEEIKRQKENLFKDMEDSGKGFLEKKRRGKETLERFIKLNEGRTDINAILTSGENEKVSSPEEEVEAILNKEKELSKQRVEKMKTFSMKNMKKLIKRKGYTEHKPIDEKDEKFIKKYAKYLLLKKIKDDITGDYDDDYERDYAKFIFTANTEDSPRSLSLNYSRKKGTAKKKFYAPELSSLNASDIRNNNYYSFIAFIKMIFAMLDKEKKGTISKTAILNELCLEDKIIQDLGFESHDVFVNLLNQYVPQNKEQNELDEKDFVQFLLSECDFKDEVLYYLNSAEEAANAKKNKKKKRRNKKKGGNDSDSEIELSDNDSSDDLPGMRTHVYDFLDCENSKEKLDKLNELLQSTIDNNTKSKKAFKSTSPRKIKIKVRNEKVKISYHEYLTFLRRYHTKDQINFTIPQPFEFLKKDYQLKKMLKMKEILEEQVAVEDALINHKFHAIKLKEGIWGNRMQNIIQYEKEQRMLRQEKLKEKIVAEMKPFTFYDADERKYREKLQQECQPPTFPPFRANAIKWLSQVNIYEDMLKKQQMEREERVKERMEKTMKAAKLPPRMQMHMEEKKRKEEEDKIYGRNKKRAKTPQYRFRANPVPDFLRLQQAFETKLENMKKAAVPTQFEPFTFHEPKKKIELCSYLDKENNPNVKNPTIKSDIHAIINKMQRKPKLEPSTTKSLNLLMETRRREIEEKQRKQDELALEDRLRKEKQDRLKERVQTSKAIVDNKRQLEENRRKLQEDFKNNLIKNKETYIADLQRRTQKVYNSPLLFEQIGSKQEKFSLNKNMKDDLNELLVEQVGIEGEEGEEDENFEEDPNNYNNEEGEEEQQEEEGEQEEHHDEHEEEDHEEEHEEENEEEHYDDHYEDHTNELEGEDELGGDNEGEYDDDDIEQERANNTL